MNIYHIAFSPTRDTVQTRWELVKVWLIVESASYLVFVCLVCAFFYHDTANNWASNESAGDVP